MKRLIYEAIRDRLKLYAKSIKTIAIYKGQDLNPSENLPYVTPSVFVNFGNFEYMTQGENTKKGEGNVEIIIVTETLESNPLRAFDVENEVLIVLENYNNWGGSIMEMIEDETDQNFTNLYVSKLIFKTDFYQDITPFFEEKIDYNLNGYGLNIEIDKQ